MPLRLGIMPFNAPVALLRTHQPLIQHLEKELGRPIVVRSSSDYYTFVNQLLDGQFDIAIAGPHFASMAQTKGWVILVRYRADLQPVLVVREGGPISEIDDLRTDFHALLDEIQRRDADLRRTNAALKRLTPERASSSDAPHASASPAAAAASYTL